MKILEIKDNKGNLQGFEVDGSIFYGLNPYYVNPLIVAWEINSQTREHYAILKRGFRDRMEAIKYIKENYLV